jgi:hypothetical protein
MSRYALVEAGTSQGMLQAYLKKHCPDLKHSAPDAPPAATIGGNVSIHGSGHMSARGGLSLRHAQWAGSGPAHRRGGPHRILRYVLLLERPSPPAGPGGAFSWVGRDHRRDHQAGHQALSRLPAERRGGLRVRGRFACAGHPLPDHRHPGGRRRHRLDVAQTGLGGGLSCTATSTTAPGRKTS